MRVFTIKNGKPQLVDGPEMVNSRLERLFKTPISSLYGFTQKGSRIMNYFHDKATKENVLAIITEAKMLVRNYEKNIKLIRIGARVFTPEDKKSATELEIFVEYDAMGQRGQTTTNMRRR